MPDRDRSTFLTRRGLAVAILLAALPVRMGLADDAGAERSQPTVTRAERGKSLAVSTDTINELIQQLGHPRYTARRMAANELRQIGPEAFDLLHTATGDADPEVAASAKYLLRQITVRWVRSDDLPAVRRLLADYGEKGDDLRVVSVAQLARLADGEGVSALCRIARFDRSPLVSRQAALAIIRPDQNDVRHLAVDPDVIDQELGPSTRVAATWLRQYLRQLRDPAAGVAGWQPLVDQEAARLIDYADDTSPEIVLGLLWNVAEVQRQLGNQPAVLAAVERMVALDEELAEATMVALLTWISKHESWDILDKFLAVHQSRVEESKRPLYFAALARAEQGQAEVANQLAERAMRLGSQPPLASFAMAKELEERGKFDWAVAEYRHVLETQKVTTHEAIISRVELGNLLFDHAQYEAAADALEPLVSAMKKDARIAQLYAEIQGYHLRRHELALPMGDSVACRYHFYRAGQYREAKDRDREREELERAIKLDRTDADVLIAMYRLPESDAAWKAAVLKQINALCQEFQQEIDEAPNEATKYNQWAWLVSNTEGDFQKAIRYSQRSLELSGGGTSAEASYLDTLGRCYYAAGDLENAVKSQRQAIEQIDHMQVMHRQLALFEKALAVKQGKQGTGSGEQGEKKEDSPPSS